jgi:hypothetical protein
MTNQEKHSELLETITVLSKTLGTVAHVPGQHEATDAIVKKILTLVDKVEENSTF